MQSIMHLVVDDPGIEEHVSDRTISIAGCGLRCKYRMVDAQTPSSRIAHLVHKCIDTGLDRLLFYEGRNRDSSGVHHGIEWAASLLVEFDGVECFATRLNTDVP